MSRNVDVLAISRDTSMAFPWGIGDLAVTFFTLTPLVAVCAEKLPTDDGKCICWRLEVINKPTWWDDVIAGGQDDSDGAL